MSARRFFGNQIGLMNLKIYELWLFSICWQIQQITVKNKGISQSNCQFFHKSVGNGEIAKY